MGQLGRPERGAAQIGAGEVGAAQVGALEVRPYQDRPGEVDPHRADAAHGGAGEPATGEQALGGPQVDAVQLGRAAGGPVAAHPELRLFDLQLDVGQPGMGPGTDVEHAMRQGLGRQAQPLDIDAGHDRAVEPGAAQAGAAQLRAVEIGVGEHRVTQVGVAQLRAAQGAVGEVHPEGQGLVQHRPVELGAGDLGPVLGLQQIVVLVGEAQDRGSEVGLVQHRAGELGAGEAAAPQVRAHQIGVAQIAAGEVGAVERRAPQVCADEAGAGQVRAGEIDLLEMAAVGLHPLGDDVPGQHARRALGARGEGLVVGNEVLELAGVDPGELDGFAEGAGPHEANLDHRVKRTLNCGSIALSTRLGGKLSRGLGSRFRSSLALVEGSDELRN